MNTKITGGKKGFQAAVDESYYGSKAHNPCVRYSHSKGFFVESALTPKDGDVIWEEQANYFASSGSKSMSKYEDVRAEILNLELA